MEKKAKKISYSKKGFTQAEDGASLSYQIIAPKKPKSYLLFVNGRTEWTGKYQDIHKRLGIEPSCAVVTWDHRGQGESDGKSGHISDYRIFTSDAASIVQQCIPSRQPYGLLAHSMGGLISILATLEGKLNPEFLVLSSPLLLLPNKPLKRPLAKGISTVLRTIGMGQRAISISHDKTDFDQNALTHSYENFLGLQNNPRKNMPPSYGWLVATFSATDKIFEREKLKNLSSPILVLGGSEEEVVDPHGFPLWVHAAKEAGVKSVTFSAIHGAKHELFNETERLLEIVRHQIHIWSSSQNIPSGFFEIDRVGN